MIVFGAGNRVQSKILPSLRALELSFAIFATKPGTLEGDKVFPTTLEELGTYSEPKFIVVCVPQKAKEQVLTTIESLGWECPTLVDTPTTKLNRHSGGNCFVLEEAALLRASNGSSIEVPNKSFSLLAIIGALPFGHGLAALNSALGTAKYPIMSANARSLFGLHFFKRGLVFWFYPKLQRGGFCYVFGALPIGMSLGFGLRGRHRIVQRKLGVGSGKTFVKHNAFSWILEFQNMKDIALTTLFAFAWHGQLHSLMDWESGAMFEDHVRSPLMFSGAKFKLLGRS